MGYMKRSLEKVIMEACHEYQAIIVTGPRQVGKTTMLQKLMEGTNRTYVTLDDLNERALAQSDPEMFFQMHKPPILIDEVQYAPQPFPYIKIHADRIIQIKENLNRIMAERCHKPLEQVMQDTERDNFMSAQEACDYGLLDRVIAHRE